MSPVSANERFYVPDKARPIFAQVAKAIAQTTGRAVARRPFHSRPGTSQDVPDGTANQGLLQRNASLNRQPSARETEGAARTHHPESETNSMPRALKV